MTTPAPAANDDAPTSPPPPTTELQRAARRLAKAAPAPRPGSRIEPTPEQLARGTYGPFRTKDPHSAAPIEVRRNAAAPLDRWRARGMIDQRQFDAADRYRTNHARAGYERSTIGRYDGGGGSGDGTPNMSGFLAGTLAQLDARKRLRAARDTLPARLAGHFDAIVLYEDDAISVGERIGQTGNLRAAFAIEYVRICASILADYYRLPS